MKNFKKMNQSINQPWRSEQIATYFHEIFVRDRVEIIRQDRAPFLSYRHSKWPDPGKDIVHHGVRWDFFRNSLMFHTEARIPVDLAVIEVKKTATFFHHRLQIILPSQDFVRNIPEFVVDTIGLIYNCTALVNFIQNNFTYSWKKKRTFRQSINQAINQASKQSNNRMINLSASDIFNSYQSINQLTDHLLKRIMFRPQIQMDNMSDNTESCHIGSRFPDNGMQNLLRHKIIPR